MGARIWSFLIGVIELGLYGVRLCAAMFGYHVWKILRDNSIHEGCLRHQFCCPVNFNQHLCFVNHGRGSRPIPCVVPHGGTADCAELEQSRDHAHSRTQKISQPEHPTRRTHNTTPRD